MVLNTRAALNDATARRLARSYQRAKPARLVETATGGFLTRPFVRDDTWLVAVAYQPSDRRSGDRSAHTTSADARGVETSGYSCVTGVVAGNAVSGTLDRALHGLVLAGVETGEDPTAHQRGHRHLELASQVLDRGQVFGRDPGGHGDGLARTGPHGALGHWVVYRRVGLGRDLLDELLGVTHRCPFPRSSAGTCAGPCCWPATRSPPTTLPAGPRGARGSPRAPRGPAGSVVGGERVAGQQHGPAHVPAEDRGKGQR